MQVRKTKIEQDREISEMSFKSRRINKKIDHISGGWPGPCGFVRWYFSSEKNISHHYPFRPAGSHLYEHAVLYIWDQTLSSLVRECGQSVEKYYYSWLKSGRYSSKIRAHGTNYQTRWNMTRSGRSKKKCTCYSTSVLTSFKKQRTQLSGVLLLLKRQKIPTCHRNQLYKSVWKR
jgi:hypothetical protein